MKIRRPLRAVCVYFVFLFIIHPILILSANANPVIPVANITMQPTFTPAPPNLDVKAYILLDANSGKVIAEKNIGERMSPASLTKLMSLYIISNALKSGAIHWDDPVLISSHAWKAEGSRMFVKVNDNVPVHDLLHGITVASGNDATIAMAEHIAGTEDTFVSMMNTQASQLGMTHSHFMDSTGLPNPDHYTTVHDLAILTQAYIHQFPEYYHFFSEKWFSYNGIRQPNRNRLLWRYPYADGLKTGHTHDAGYCLISSANKDGMRLISIIMGAPSDQARTEESIQLLTYGYRFYQTRKLYSANQAITQARVWRGATKEVPLGLTNDLYLTASTTQYGHLQTNLVIENPLKAPIVKGQPYGTLNIMHNNRVIASQSIVALVDDQKGSLWRSLSDSIHYKIKKMLSKSDENLNNG